jgi:septum formation protein
MKVIPDGKKLILASKSPRRQQLLSDLGLDFEVRTQSVDEDYSKDLKGAQIARFLAEKKAQALIKTLDDDEILLTSDTVVWCKGESLEKAKDAQEATSMLKTLSGHKHEVITGVCLWSKNKQLTFSDTVVVHFKELNASQIDYYVKTYKPFDKAGAYGIQEWIGMVAIKSITGSYFTVMGLPTHLIMEKLPLF